jgi:Transposase, Mutator family
MSTRTQNHSIEGEDHAGFSRREPEGRVDRETGVASAEGGPRAGRRGRSGPARAQLVDEALDRARAGLDVAELPEGVREQLTDAMLDELLAGREGEAEILGTGGLLGELTRRLVERALSAELTSHLGYEPGGAPLGGSGNARNGGTPKTLLTDHGAVRIDTPRDRQGSFEPVPGEEGPAPRARPG